jgi:hypothetical protein
MKHFRIVGWLTEKDTIKVNVMPIDNDNCFVPVTIPLHKFNRFLEQWDKLKLVYDSSNHCGEHIQLEDRFDVETYWAVQEDEWISEDLYEYICKNSIEFRGEVIQNSVQSILNSFKNHSHDQN